MYERYAFAVLIVGSSFLAVTASTSRAERIPVQAASPSSPFVVAEPCSLGEKLHGPPGTSIDFTNDPGLTFYTLLDPDSCSGCSGNSLVLRAARFRVESRGASCTFSVEVTILGARPGAGCPLEPDPRVVLCGPVPADITIPLAPPRAYDASVPLPGSCCIDRPAFLRVKLVSRGTCNPEPPNQFLPGIYWFCHGLDACVPCMSFMESDVTPFHDTCQPGSIVGNPVQWVDAECCDLTPTQHRTWGQVKTHYR